jgi:glycosyltransferase involved in cell wall biosynthesis
MDGPLVSIVIPAFNAETTLAETVTSALSGRYRNIEIIIVDDGSSDGTAAAARRLGRTDPRVRLLQRANGGLPAALNSGFAVAQGEYVARLDSDDVWHREKLVAQLRLARERPDVAFIYTLFRYIDGENCVLRDGPIQAFPSYALARGVYETILGTGSSVLMRRSSVEAVGGCEQSPRTWEDLLLQLKISAAHEIAFVPEYLVGIRLRRGSLSQRTDEMLAGWRQIRARLRELFPQVPARIHNWGHAFRMLEIAESYAWRGRYGASAARLLDALAHDPAFGVRFLQYRLARSARRRLQAKVEHQRGRNFFDYEPDEPAGLDPFGIAAEGAALLKLREKRLNEIVQVDQALGRLRD